MRGKKRLSAKTRLLLLLAGVCAVGCLVLLGVYFLKDREAPVISYTETRLTLSAEDVSEIKELDYSCLLEDVTAYDTRDGVLNDRVIVKNYRLSSDKVYAVITYQVTDYSANTAYAKRIVYLAEEVYNPIYYTPVITLTTDTIVVPAWSNPDIADYIEELSDETDTYEQLLENVAVYGTYDLNKAGEYQLAAYVTDQDGNVSEPFPFTLIVE